MASSSACSFLGVVTTNANAGPTSATDTASEIASEAPKTSKESRTDARKKRSLGVLELEEEAPKSFEDILLGWIMIFLILGEERGLIVRKDVGGSEERKWERGKQVATVAAAAAVAAIGLDWINLDCCCHCYRS